MKKMEAFAILRTKDAIEAAVPVVRGAALVLGALALLCINTALFRVLVISTLGVAAVFIAAKAAIFVSRYIISFLGFSEPGLERMALGV